MDMAAEREPEIREQVKEKLVLQRIAKENREEELKEQEQSYQQSLLELAIEDPEIGNFVEEDLEVEKMSLEELTALFASGDFGFNFVDDDIAPRWRSERQPK
jgi:thioredoxin-related protein